MGVPETEKMKNEKKQKRNTKMATLSPNILLITGTLNTNSLNILPKRII